MRLCGQMVDVTEVACHGHAVLLLTLGLGVMMFDGK